MHDIVIRGGELVDGTGAEPVAGDLAISDGRIAQVGDVGGKGRREIDADGLTVTPGFIDLHTHLDAQIGWDPALTPVSWHGVTTVLMGNCGVTFAPCKPSDQELLAGMMETVEDIPKNAILTGLPWDWEDYGGYLDAIERLNPGINVAGMVGHCAVRFYVMGERAVEEQASDDERRQMADIVGASIDRGAVGFSTNRHAPHRLPDGRSVPGTFADPAELVEIGKAVGPRNGLMQAVGANFDVLKQIAGATRGRVLFSYGAGAGADTGLERKRALEELREQAGDVTAITHVRSSGSMFGLQSRLPVAGETWNELRKLDLAGRLKAIRNADFAAKLVEEAKREKAMRLPAKNLFYLGVAETPDYTAGPEASLQAMADAAGEHWCETLLRLSRESNGLGLFNYRAFAPNMNALGRPDRARARLPRLGRRRCPRLADHGRGMVHLPAIPLGTGHGPLQHGRRHPPTDLRPGARHRNHRPRHAAAGHESGRQRLRCRSRHRVPAATGTRLPRRRAALHPAVERLQDDDRERRG